MQTVLQILGLAGIAFLVGFSGAMMPGPLLAVTIGESSRRGWKAGPLLVLGHALLEGALVAAVVLGLSRVLNHPVTIMLISLTGGIVMSWMGWSMLRASRSLTWDSGAGGASGMHPILAGVVVSLANPYWTIWWATIGLTYLMVGLRFGPAGVFAFFAGHILADLTWYSLVSFGVSKGRRVLSDKVYRRLAGLCALAVLGFGFWFLAAGLSAAWERFGGVR